MESTDRLPDLSSPFDYMYLVLISETTKRREIIKVTEFTGTTLTVERAQDETTAGQFYTGDTVEGWITAQSLRDLVTTVEQAYTRPQKEVFTVTTQDLNDGCLYLITDPLPSSTIVFAKGSPIQVEFGGGAGADYLMNAGNQVCFLNEDIFYLGSEIHVMYEILEEI